MKMTKDTRPEGFEQIFFADGYRLAKAHPVEKDLSKLKIGLRQLHHNADLLIDAFTQRCESENIPVDCHMGCQWCCYQAVFASTPEMIVIVDYLKRRFSGEIIERIKEKAREKDSRLSMLSPDKVLTTSHPCPLLHNGSCMVYPVRPMACRIYLSSSKKSCKAKFDHPDDPKIIPPLFDFTLKAGRHLNEGYTSALREKNLKIEEHRIEHILLLLLDSPEKINEWLQGTTIHKSFPFDEVRKH